MKPRTFNTPELELSNFIARFYKDNIGKGPRNVDIKFAENIIIYFVEGLLTQLERSILNSEEGKNNVSEGRRLIVNNWRPQRIEAFERILNQKILDEYVVLDMEKDMAIGIVILEKKP